MDTTLLLTGLLSASIIAAGVLTLPASVFLLWLYRRATISRMVQPAVPDQQWISHPQTDNTGTDVQLAFDVLSDDTDMASATRSKARHWNAVLSSRRAARAYALGGLAYALIMAGVWMYLSGGFSVERFFWLLVIYLWPTVVALNVLVSISLWETMLISLLYVLAVMLIGGVFMLTSDQLTAAQLMIIWINANLPASVVFIVFLQQRIRSVGPMVYCFMLAGVIGVFLLNYYSGTRDDVLYAIAAAGSALGLNAISVLLVLGLIGFAVFALHGWVVLKMIGRRYQRKRISDQSMTLDSMWLMFAIVQSLSLAFEGAVWVLTGLVAFVGYKLVSSFSLNRMSKKQDAPARLLLLRVFALGRRSNEWFYRFSKLWRHAGCVNMIAGPDLVTLAVEPHEFLSFLGGGMSRQFVKNEHDLESRISDLDCQADVDQRYRVNEFFCHDDTWRLTLQRLATESESVLMDLRSFSENNQGCLYELKVLLDNVDLKRVLLLTDDTTNTTFLKESLNTMALNTAADSPNLLNQPVHVRLFHLNKANRTSVNKVMRLLLQPGRNQAVPVGQTP